VARKVDRMKLSHSMVSVIAIGAVLVSAYAVGLLIRQVRLGSGSPTQNSALAVPSRPAVPAAGETTDVAARRGGPDAGSTKDTSMERAQVKEKRAKTLEKMGALTKEEQEQFKDKVIKQVGGRRGGKTPGNLSPEERQARKMKAQGPSPAGGQTQDANTPTAPKESTNSK
jgi:hypothetical protein